MNPLRLENGYGKLFDIFHPKLISNRKIVLGNLDCELPEEDLALHVGEHHGHDLDNDPPELRKKGWHVRENDKFPYDVVELVAELKGPGTIFMTLSAPKGVNISLEFAQVLRHLPKDDEKEDLDSDGIYIPYNQNVLLSITGRYLELYKFLVYCPGK